MGGSQEPGQLASEYLQRHGGEAIIHLDGQIATALNAQRWDDYGLLLRVRLRLRRLELFEQISQRLDTTPARELHRTAV